MHHTALVARQSLTRGLLLTSSIDRAIMLHTGRCSRRNCYTAPQLYTYYAIKFLEQKACGPVRLYWHADLTERR